MWKIRNKLSLSESQYYGYKAGWYACQYLRFWIEFSRHQTMCRDSTSKQYFGHCAIIWSRILTGSCWEDSQQNSGSDCLFRFILTGLGVGVQVLSYDNLDAPMENAVQQQMVSLSSYFVLPSHFVFRPPSNLVNWLHHHHACRFVVNLPTKVSES
jgi:hypothetical protein